ncbi:hypothetical protein ACT8ZR_12015 [Neobacillus sp. M.A.Huq-85]|nr:hypothetical protein QNK12_29285 [Neobacillus cucumis]
MKKYLPMVMAIILLFSVAFFGSTAEAATTNSYSIKDQKMKKVTFYVKTLKKKKEYGSTYYSYQLATKYPGKSKKILSTKLKSQYYIDGDTSCAAGSDDKVRIRTQKSSPTIIYSERDFCGDIAVVTMYTIKNGNLTKVKRPADIYFNSIKYTGKNKLQAWSQYRDGDKTIYNFTYNSKTNSLKLVSSNTKYMNY